MGVMTVSTHLLHAPRLEQNGQSDTAKSSRSEEWSRMEGRRRSSSVCGDVRNCRNRQRMGASCRSLPLACQLYSEYLKAVAPPHPRPPLRQDFCVPLHLNAPKNPGKLPPKSLFYINTSSSLHTALTFSPTPPSPVHFGDSSTSTTTTLKPTNSELPI